jgi:hypothetical protein
MEKEVLQIYNSHTRFGRENGAERSRKPNNTHLTSLLADNIFMSLSAIGSQNLQRMPLHHLVPGA